MQPIRQLRRTAITHASSLLPSLVRLRLLRFGMANVKPKKCITIHYRPPPTIPVSSRRWDDSQMCRGSGLGGSLLALFLAS
jgi:hypothetical protein